MALSFVDSGTWIFSTGTVTPTMPTGWAAGDLLVLFLVSKYETAVLPSEPAGWTDLGFHSYTGLSPGNDNGNLRCRAFWKIAEGGDTGPALSPSPNNISGAHITAYRKAAGELFDIQAEFGADNLTGSPLNVSTSGNISIAPNDIIHVDMAVNGDAPTWGTTTISASGVTFGTMSTPADGVTTSGTDLRVRYVRRPVNSGTTSAVVTSATALGGTVTNAAGLGLVLRIRVVTPVHLKNMYRRAMPVHRAVR